MKTSTDVLCLMDLFKFREMCGMLPGGSFGIRISTAPPHSPSSFGVNVAAGVEAQYSTPKIQDVRHLSPEFLREGRSTRGESKMIHSTA